MYLTFFHRSNLKLVKLPCNVLQGIHCDLHLKIQFHLQSLLKRYSQSHLASVADEVVLELLEPDHLPDPSSIAPQASSPLQDKLSHVYLLSCQSFICNSKKDFQGALCHILLADQYVSVCGNISVKSARNKY